MALVWQSGRGFEMSSLVSDRTGQCFASVMKQISSIGYIPHLSFLPRPPLWRKKLSPICPCVSRRPPLIDLPDSCKKSSTVELSPKMTVLWTLISTPTPGRRKSQVLTELSINKQPTKRYSRNYAKKLLLWAFKGQL